MATSNQEETFKRCPNCQNFIPEPASVCMYCGADQERSAAKSRTPKKGMGIGKLLLYATGTVFACIILTIIGNAIGNNRSTTGGDVSGAIDSSPTFTPTPAAQAAPTTINPVPAISTPALPTNTPAPPADTPTPAPPALEILSHQAYTDNGWFKIVGEVRNNGPQPAQFVQIVATLYNDNNGVTGTDFTFTDLDVLLPGEISPFETGTDSWAGTTNYKLQVQGRQASNAPRRDVAILSHSSYVDNGWFHVRGEVQNNGAQPAEFVQIIITLYDATGAVVGVDFTFTDIDTIAPGGTSPFETGTDHWAGTDHYAIQVQAR